MLIVLGLAGCRSLEKAQAPDEQPPAGGNQTNAVVTPPNEVKIAGDSRTDADIGKALADKNAKGSPKLRAGLLMDITVTASGVKEHEEKGKRITQEGTITLPLVGTVKCVGMTLVEFSRHLTKLYEKYLRAPDIHVEFVTGPGSIYPWGYVTVLGRVNRPGRVNMPPTGDMSVSMAIQKAGGLGKSARETGVIVVRKERTTGGVERFEVNLRAAAKKGEKADMKLRAGDVVYVPVRIF